MSNIKRFSSRKEVTEFLATKGVDTSNWSEEKWLLLNKGQAEIHIMDLAEKIYDVMQESTPVILKENDWHIPMINGIEYLILSTDEQIKLSVGRAANTSYTVVGDGKELTLEQAIKIHDKCKELNHSSVFEHCAKAMSNKEYSENIKGRVYNTFESSGPEGATYQIPAEAEGWCRNLKGFIPYRHIIESGESF